MWMAPWIHFKGHTRCFGKRRRPRLAKQRSHSIYLSGDWNRHSAISVYHFCFTSISELLFTNRQRAPCESTQHFPFHLCVAFSGSTTICLWLFPIFPQRVQARTQTENGKRERRAQGGETKMVKWNTYTSVYVQAQTVTLAHTKVEVMCHEAIFHCYYDRAQRA